MREVYVAQPKPKPTRGQFIKTPDGKSHRYLNCALPKDRDGNLLCHPIDCLCERCGHGYSAQAKRLAQPCEECHGEDVAERAAWLERELGIDLGCGTAGLSERAGRMSKGEKQAMVKLRGKPC